MIFTEKKIKILPSITTTGDSNWERKIREIEKLKIKEVCLFLTVLTFRERDKLYKLLEKTKIKKIPFVHLRSDMKIDELDYLVKNYKTEVFNTHTEKEYPLIYDYSKYADLIYIENIYYPIDEEEIKRFGGICLDFAHLENDRILEKEKFKHNLNLIKKYPVGCSHISAIKKKTRIDSKGYKRYDFHYFENLSEFNYLKKYPLKFFPLFNALELENSIEEQLEVGEYIAKLLNVLD